MIYETDQPAGHEKETTKATCIVLSQPTTPNIRGLKEERI